VREFRDDLRRVLSRAYKLKVVADYESGPGSDVSESEAKGALAMAADFLAGTEHLLAGSTTTAPKRLREANHR